MSVIQSSPLTTAELSITVLVQKYYREESGVRSQEEAKVGCVSDSVTHHSRLNQNCKLLNLRSLKVIYGCKNPNYGLFKYINP